MRRKATLNKRYKRKLRKYKREIEIERKINEKLKSKLSLFQPNAREDNNFGRLYNIETTSYGDDNEAYNRSKKYLAENENKRYLSNKGENNRISSKNMQVMKTRMDDDEPELEFVQNQNCNSKYISTETTTIQNNQTVRRNKSQTLTGNRALNIEDLIRNNTPSHMSTHKNLREYLMKIEPTM